MTQSSSAFVPLAPVQLVKPNGTVKGYGLGAATDAARGTALWAAVAAAVSGDEIIVGPGTFTRSTGFPNLAKNGVHYHFMEGATVLYNGPNYGAFWDDSAASGTGGAIVCKVTGHAVFRNAAEPSTTHGGTAADPMISCVWISNASSNLLIEAGSFEMTGVGRTDAPLGYDSVVIWQSNGYLNLLAHRRIYELHTVGSSVGCVYWSNGPGWIRATEIVSAGTDGAANVGAIFMLTGIDGYTGGDFYVTAEHIETTEGTAVTFSSVTANTTVAAWITAKTIKGPTSVKSSGIKGYVTAQKLLGQISIVSPTANQKLYVTAQKAENDVTALGAIIELLGGRSWMNINELSDLGGSVRKVDVSGGTHDLWCQTLLGHASSSADMVRATGASTTLNLHAGHITPGTSGAPLVQASSGTLNIGPNVSWTGTPTGTLTRRPAGASAAQTTAGTIDYLSVTPDGLAGSDFGKRVATILVTDPNGSALTTGDGKAYFRVPAVLSGYNLVTVAASVDTASSSGDPTVQLRRKRSGADVDMLSTALSIDANETDSTTAATAAVINASNDDVATADRIYVDVDTAGTGTKGLTVQMTFQLP